jgi:hypothetical protein
LDVGGQVDAVYLDTSKASDKVKYKHLLHKLRMAGFGGRLLQWFQSYLTNRHQRVTAQGSTSTTLPVTSGVPQGSIDQSYSASMSTTIQMQLHLVKLLCLLMPDDTKLFKNIKSIRDSKQLQNDLKI